MNRMAPSLRVNVCNQRDKPFMSQNGSTDQSDEILATEAGFVPTALNVAEDVFEGDSSESWQVAIRRAVRTTSRLRELLRLPPEPVSNTAKNGFPTFVPLEYLRRITPGDPNDPLLRQVLPIAAEDDSYSGESADPVGDRDAVAAPGLLHKYHGRALLIVTGACGVHCRYCFRQEFPYRQDSGAADHWEHAIDYLSSHQEIEEVLLSGGDPLTQTDRSLSRLLHRIDSIDHIRRLRVHTRMPIVIPQRITDELVELFRQLRMTTWFVVHANHPRELDDAVLDRLGRLIDNGIPVMNQAVLLKGVNDDAATLIQLCRRLVDHRIQPYYLHQLDRVRGTQHFEVSVKVGNQLMTELRASLPGYAVPKYVVEDAGKTSKTPVRDDATGEV
ncbi:MAG: EF-P beta-lysylation protein EpmB [Planctomycetota bacterium]